MRHLCAGILSLAFICAPASAQNAASKPKLDVRGQIFLPNGDPAPFKIRFHLSGEDGQRPPESYTTDSKGSFVCKGLRQGSQYTFLVESDGRNWTTTTQNVLLSGPDAYVTIRLQPILKSPVPERPSISAAEIKQTVPPAAQREYEHAIAKIAAGDMARARKQLERAIALFPNFVEARSELAVVYMRQDALATAEGLLRQALEIDPAAPRPLLNLGLCLYRQRRFAEARPLFERGLQLMPESANGNLLYGATLIAAGDDALAEPVLRKAYELGGTNCAKAQLYLSQIYARQKKFDLAADALEIYLRDVPSDPDAESLRATLFKLRSAARP